MSELWKPGSDPQEIDPWHGYVCTSSGLWEPPARGGIFVAPGWLTGAFDVPLRLMSFGPRTPKAPQPDLIKDRTEPFLGWKTLKIKVTTTGKVKLRGAGGSNYGVDATAKCNHNETHASPEWKCTCGFYAYSEKPTKPEWGWFRAEVELFGTVIAGEKGWRASRQRVLSMEAFRDCRAHDDKCERPADGFQISPKGKVWPVCAKHAPLGYSTLSDLTGRLGTEVRWADG